jgi:hypothetical protein
MTNAAPAASSSDASGCIAGLLVLGFFAALIYLLYICIVDDPTVPAELDSTGYISHKVQGTISAQANWMVGESKDCISYPLDAEAARAAGQEPGYAFYSVQCDDGPVHNMSITFWGSKSQPGKVAALWNCRRVADSFICKQTGAL